MDNIVITTKQLEDYQYCPLFYKIKYLKDKRLQRMDEVMGVSYPYEAIRKTIYLTFEHIFKTNKEPNEKSFLNTVLKVYDSICPMTKAEKFVNTPQISKMVDVAEKVFSFTERLFNNIIVHPIQYDINLNYGKHILSGRALPIIRQGGRPTILLVDHNYNYTNQIVYTDLNLAGYVLWLRDTMPDVEYIAQLNIKHLNKGLMETKLEPHHLFKVQDYLSTLCTLISNGAYWPSNYGKCTECLGTCLNYL